MGFGRCGERVAKTPTFFPYFGGWICADPRLNTAGRAPY
jgi:hypothetical protein